MQMILDVPDEHVSAITAFLQLVPGVKAQAAEKPEKEPDEDKYRFNILPNGRYEEYIPGFGNVPWEGYWDGREDERPQAVAGCVQGKIWMADDFDAPLEDFKEYME